MHRDYSSIHTRGATALLQGVTPAGARGRRCCTLV